MFVAVNLVKCGVFEIVFSYFVSGWKLVSWFVSFLIIVRGPTAFLPHVSFVFLLLLNDGTHIDILEEPKGKQPLERSRRSW